MEKNIENKEVEKKTSHNINISKLISNIEFTKGLMESLGLNEDEEW